MIVTIGVIAALVTIGGFLMGAWRLSRSLDLTARRQDLGRPVTKAALSYADIGRGLEDLVKDAKRFKPDVIIGINRGGAIVGGIVAKKLEIDRVHILEVHTNPNTRVELQNAVGLAEAKNILLADDALHRGGHMRAATAHLKATFPGATIRAIVLLECLAVNAYPFQQEERGILIDHHAFFTSDLQVRLPWYP